TSTSTAWCAPSAAGSRSRSAASFARDRGHHVAAVDAERHAVVDEALDRRARPVVGAGGPGLDLAVRVARDERAIARVEGQVAQPAGEYLVEQRAADDVPDADGVVDVLGREQDAVGAERPGVDRDALRGQHADGRAGLEVEDARLAVGARDEDAS